MSHLRRGNTLTSVLQMLADDTSCTVVMKLYWLIILQMSLQCTHVNIDPRVSRLHVPPQTPSLIQTHIPDPGYPSHPMSPTTHAHIHPHTHTPWPETSSPQVTDVCMWGDDCNEYWVSEVISLPFCLMLPPTLTLQPPGSQSLPHPFSSRWQPLVPLAHQCHQAGRISQLGASYYCEIDCAVGLKESDFSIILAEVVVPVAMTYEDWQNQLDW